MKKSEKLLTVLLVLLVAVMAALCTLSVKKEMASDARQQRQHVNTP